MSMVTGCTTLFKNKWVDTYGEEPEIFMIEKKLRNNSIVIQRYEIFASMVGKKNQIVKILASYWIPEDALIIKIDTVSKSCVTFYTKNDLLRR